MLRRTQRRPPLPAGLLGLALALWALVSQVALGSIVLPADLAAQQGAIAQLDAASMLCSAASPAGRHAPMPLDHTPDRALCPLQAALATSGLIFADVPVLPLPADWAGVGCARAASACGPLPAPHSARFARGPPPSA